VAPQPVPAGEAPRPPWIVWAGLAVVLAAAAVLSFDALRALALAVGISSRFAWLLPVAVDAGAAVSCATWLGGRTTRTAARFAGRMTWALLAVTVAGNAAQLGMHAHNVAPPWWVAVLVGSIPPAVVGSVVHLVVLLVRRTDDEAVDRPGPIELDEPDRPGPEEWTDPWERWADEAVPVGPNQADTPAPVPAGPAPDQRGPADRTDDELMAQLRAYADRLGRRPGRNAVATELAIGAGRAARLLEKFDRTGPRRAA